MKQLTLPLDWPDDSKASAQPRTWTLSEFRQLALASPGIWMGDSCDSLMSRLLASRQTYFSGPSWQIPRDVFFCFSPLQRLRQDGSPLFPILPTTWGYHDYAAVTYECWQIVKIGAPAPRNFVNGALLAGRSFPASFFGAKPKLPS